MHRPDPAPLPPEELPPEELPPAVEELAAEILEGPAAAIDGRFADLCAAHEPQRPALERLRRDYQRAARAFDGIDPDGAWAMPAAIGPYRLLRPIGEGAFGTVFLAEQREPIRRQVAIKLLHGRTGSRSAVARFPVERETLARMNHPAIARIFDAGVDPAGRPYFVMEYVPGEPLHRFAAARGAGLRARIELFLLACEGVRHAHQRGVIHRDLKPQNILVAEADGGWQPKVIDFGLAKIVAGDDLDAVATHAGAVLGTPAYMSPEQVRGRAGDADIRTDIYALGVILYELLAGRLPIATEAGATSLAELQRLICEVEPPPASAVAARAGLPFARELRGDLDWILRKAMAKEADERYPTVDAFAADLRRHLSHQPVVAGPPSTIYLLRKFVRRHRVSVVAASLVLASLVLGLAASAALYRTASANAARAQAHLADFWRLADVVELEVLVQAAVELWPSTPARLADHERWLQAARGLLERRALHGEALRALQARLQHGGLPPEEERGVRFLGDRLQHHLAALDGFAGEGGVVGSVTGRAEFARTVQARSIDDRRAAWDRAVAAVGSSERYGHLRLQPMLGLVPLGPDPASGLEEFAHLQSGTVPDRDANGRLAISDDTGIVLVLVPGGRIAVGNQDQDPAGPHYDPWRQIVETDLQTVDCEPFLLGKYELTQGQVRALGVSLQALGRMGTTQVDAPAYSARHPEESVLGPVVAGWLPQFELRLPDTTEWEVAARAGSPAVWGAGDRAVDLQGNANVADATLGEAGHSGREADPAVRDGFTSHAPVGSFAPNGFGLHDVLGNVAELTQATADDGRAVFLARGGSFMLPPKACRIGSVRLVMPNQTTPELGVRAARNLPR